MANRRRKGDSQNQNQTPTNNSSIFNNFQNRDTLTLLRDGQGHQSQGRPRRGRNKGQSDLNRKVRVLRNRIVVLALLSFIFGSIIFVYLFFGNEVEVVEIIQENEDMKSASRILNTIVEVCNALLLFELQMTTFLEGERLANLLKEELQPVQDRVTSLTTQTSQYEKMDHISGGPTHFIQTSINELDHLEENQLSSLDDRVQEIINEETYLALAMGDSVLTLFEKASFVLDVMRDTKLIDEGIYISPTEEIDDGVFVEKMLTKYTLEELLVIMTELVDKLERKEKAMDKLKGLRKKIGLRSWDDVVDFVNFDEEHLLKFPELRDTVDIYEWWAEEVESFVEEHEVVLQLILPLHTQTMNKVGDLQEELDNYATNKRRAYLNLRATLREDIRRLKVRIQNLRYKYAKISAPNEIRI